MLREDGVERCDRPLLIWEYVDKDAVYGIFMAAKEILEPV